MEGSLLFLFGCAHLELSEHALTASKNPHSIVFQLLFSLCIVSLGRLLLGFFLYIVAAILLKRLESHILLVLLDLYHALLGGGRSPLICIWVISRCSCILVSAEPVIQRRRLRKVIPFQVASAMGICEALLELL